MMVKYSRRLLRGLCFDWRKFGVLSLSILPVGKCVPEAAYLIL